MTTWWPVIMRGGLWVTIAMLQRFLTEGAGIADRIDTMTTFKWFLFAGGVLLDGVITLRTYVDQSLANHKDEMVDEKHEEKVVTTTKTVETTKDSSPQPQAVDDDKIAYTDIPKTHGLDTT